MSAPVRRRTLLLAAVATVLATALAPVGCAQASSLTRVDVYDRSADEALPTYHHRGQRYVEGRIGNEYAVRIRNCSDRRILAVLSVDGVNAISGETAAVGQSGYVIEPYGYVTVQGWRKSYDRTAAFYFTDHADSYAERTGRPDDLGVIGVAVFREVAPQPVAEDRRLMQGLPRGELSKSNAAGEAARERSADAAAAAPAPLLGTGHGRSEYSPVRQVEFERASSNPDEVVAIRYEARETLVALGVLPPTRNLRWREPEPFPGMLGFVPDP